MAPVTRFSDLQEAQKEIDQILHTETLKREASELKLQEQIMGLSTEVNAKFDHVSQTLASIQLQLLNKDKGKSQLEEESLLGDPTPLWAQEGSFSRNQQNSRNRLISDQSGIFSPIPKIDFPRFDGTQPRAWILKCQGYFDLIPNIPDPQKVTLASMHLEGKTALWYQNLVKRGVELSWDQFLDIVSARFEELKEARIIAEFNKLKHVGSYSDYVDKFEELRSYILLIHGGNFSDEYFKASFVSGLSEELQATIRMFKPTSLQQTIELGHDQIQSTEALARKFRGASKPTPAYSLNFRRSDSEDPIPKACTPQSSTISNKPPFKLLTTAEMAKRRELGLCYNCDDPFTIRHRCTQRISYMIMTEEKECSYLQSTDETYPEDVEPATSLEEVQITLSAITSEHGLTTMKLLGIVGKHKINILIDSGSTLSFINERTTKSLGCILDPVKPVMVKVANGHKMVSSTRVSNFKWSMQHLHFTYSPRVLATDGYDLILGGDWLKSCTPIELEYDKMTVTITVSGKQVKIQAMTVEGHCDFNFISETALFKMVHFLPSQIEKMSCIKVKDYNEEAIAHFVIALSRTELEEALCEASVITSPSWVQQVINSHARYKLHSQILEVKPPDPNVYPRFEICDEILRYKDRVSVGYSNSLRGLLLWEIHNCPYESHFYTSGTVVYMCLEAYLKRMLHQNHRQGVKLISLVEFRFKTKYCSSLKLTPIEAIYG